MLTSPILARRGDESFDTNDYLTFDVPRGQKYRIQIDGTDVEKTIELGDRAQLVVELKLNED